jgi:ubiquinone/menaquinone biosynthesis C-methylase UbiE
MPPLRVPLSPRKIRKLYGILSSFYDSITRYEKSSRQRALEIARVEKNSIVLEVGFGTGKALAEMAGRNGNGGEVFGLDVSEKMTKRARRSIEHNHLSGQVHLLLGDMGNAPFRDAMFDVVFGSYVLDLIDTPRIPLVLSEFRRVLRPSGRLVLVSLSRGSKWYDNMTFYEWLYTHAPTLLGGCRPVELSAYLEKLGFKGITRHFMHAGHLMPTEIVSSLKGD